LQAGSKQMREASEAWNEYDDRLLGQGYDLLLTNGNHYPAARQIVFVDPQKAGTLERRREQFSKIAAVVLCPGATEMPTWLKEDLGDAAPVLTKFSESKEVLLPLIKNAAAANRPPLKAIVLAGGKSTRMGTDKSQLIYQNGETELNRMVGICRELGVPTHVSVAAQDQFAPGEVPVIVDRFPGLGPFGAICTAFQQDPDAAWLVLACDLPLFDSETLRRLVAARDSRQVATAIKGATKPFPEPLLAIYEPRAYSRMLSFLALGYSCPRKVLINSEVALVELADEAPLVNANKPEERAAVLERLAEGA
ncbi:MAG: NTP transferase domain-containing protein, partial [Bacteroidota bacterium]